MIEIEIVKKKEMTGNVTTLPTGTVFEYPDTDIGLALGLKQLVLCKQDGTARLCICGDTVLKPRKVLGRLVGIKVEEIGE